MARRRKAKLRLLESEVAALWAAYIANRENVEVRDRLVEHYLPWARQRASNLARHLCLQDHENAIGEALLAFSTRVVPHYDGHGAFLTYAGRCMGRALIDLLRRQRQAMASLDAPIDGQCDCSTELLDLLPAPAVASSDLRFCEMAAGLTDIEAIVLWCRYYRGLSVIETARVLKVCPGTVKSRTAAAVARLRQTAGKQAETPQISQTQ